ncbi:hypothetical protein GGR57DRAFT_513234 [Xylariaceae sp. FL1272]|nr:hypothetical protein GGR57DRAFT_513234 [Xylariaceae sp. FL1272]
MYASTAIVTEQDNMVPTIYGTREFNVSSVPVDVDAHMRTAIKYSMLKEATIMFDNNTLEHIVQDYYTFIGAVIAKQSLMQRTPRITTGISKGMDTRLVIRLSTARSMVGLLATGTFLVAAAMFFVPADGRLLHSNTNCLFNSIFLLRHSSELMRMLRCAAASDDHHLSQWLSKYKFSSGMYRTIDSCKEQFQIAIDGASGSHQGQRDRQKWATFPRTRTESKDPNILHPAMRSLVCVTVVSLIIGLEVSISRSELRSGLGSAPIASGLYNEYPWTLLPAFVLGGLSKIFANTDFAIRTLTPYIALRGYVSGDKFAELDLLDMTIPVAVHRALELRIPWAIATTAATLFGSLFATLSSSIFLELPVADDTPLVLPSAKSFPLTAPCADTAGEIAGQISSLIFQSNLSYRLAP